jgi:hypothetical protein
MKVMVQYQHKQIKINKSNHTPVLFVSDVLVPSGVVVLVVPAFTFAYAQPIFIQYRMLGALFFVTTQRKLSAERIESTLPELSFKDADDLGACSGRCQG